MGIKDRFKQISTAASNRTDTEPLDRAREPRQPRTAPGMAAAASRLFSEEREQLREEINHLRLQLEQVKQGENETDRLEIERLKKLLDEKETVFGIKKIATSECFHRPATADRPARKRTLSKKDFDALRQSIKAVGMSVPILVEPREEGGYWIIAGHNRHEVHVLEHIDTIRAEVVDPEELDVESAALVSNLLTPELSTFEFYQGIKFFRDTLGKTLGEIADITGRAKSTISEYFALEKLPEEVQQFLASSNLKIGSNQIAALAKVVTKNNVNEALTALQSFTQGSNIVDKITPGEGAETPPKKKGQINRPSILKVLKDGTHIATLTNRNNSVSIRFAGKVVPEGFLESVENLLTKSDT